jgi:hypothetical protein
MRAKKKDKPVRRKRALSSMKHVNVKEGQELTVHVLGARNKEVSCQVLQVNADGNVQFAPTPEPTPVTTESSEATA